MTVPVRFLAASSVLALALTATLPSVALPQQSGGLVTKEFKIDTNQTDYNLNSGEFRMPNHVKFTRPGSDATADSATGNSKRGYVDLKGHVELHDNGQAPEVTGSGAQEYQGPATLTCDELQIDSKARMYTAIGNVKFTQGTRHGTAQRGTLDRNRQLLHLEGDVALSDGPSTIEHMNTIDYNLATKDTHAVGSPLIIRQPVPSDQPAPPGTTPTPKPKKKK